LTGYVRSEAVSLSNGSSLYRSRRAHDPPIARVKNIGQPSVMEASKMSPLRIVVK
jgi:hypothetical protein